MTGPATLRIDPPPPEVARCWLPWPRGDRLRMGTYGLMAWEWRAAWCPQELAAMAPEQVYQAFKTLDGQIGEFYRDLRGRLAARMAPTMSAENRDERAGREAWQVVVAEWIKTPKEVEQAVYHPSWIDEIERAVTMQIEELAGYVMSFGAQRAPAGPPEIENHWGEGLATVQEMLDLLTPLQRHLVFSEARRQVMDRRLDRTPGYEQLAGYPAPAW